MDEREKAKEKKTKPRKVADPGLGGGRRGRRVGLVGRVVQARLRHGAVGPGQVQFRRFFLPEAAVLSAVGGALVLREEEAFIFLRGSSPKGNETTTKKGKKSTKNDIE